MFKQGFLFRALALSSLLLGAPAQAVSIQYQASDLADSVPGQDLWQYAYQVSGSFAAFDGFNLLFDSTLYGSVDEPPVAVNADWAIVTTQPVIALGADGLYTATAVTDNPSLADVFTVSFVWLGTGSPGAQTFEAFDGTSLDVVLGSTTPLGAPGLPEPGSLLLVAGALALLGWRKRFC